MNSIFDAVKALGPARILATGVVLATVIAFFVVLTTRLTSPNMVLLYGELNQTDAGQITSKLEAMGVPFELKGNGTIIHVPSDQVLRLRMSMATQGLPTGGSVGYELFDRSDSLGTTSFVQNINHLRAMEGEMARTIATIDKVASARVHLVLPRRELFSRERRKASASIILKVRGNRLLDLNQVAAIQALVSAAVPGLKAEMVSIVDDRGNLLSRRSNPTDPSGVGTIGKHRLSYETRVKEALESMIERSAGLGSVRVEVSAEMNFDRITTNSELYDPDGQVARSTQSVEQSESSAEAGSSGTVSVSTNLPDQDVDSAGGGNTQNKSGRVEETINYEISKTVRTQVHESGTVKRLSVAVLVDGTYETEGEGDEAKRVYKPRSEEDLKQIEDLVISSIGFDEARGDTVKVINMRFARVEDDPDFVVDEGFALTKGDIFRLAEVGSLAVIGILVIFLVLRPLISRVLTPGQLVTAEGLPVQLDEEGQPVVKEEVKVANQLPAVLTSQLTNPDVIKAVESGSLADDEAQQLVQAAVARLQGGSATDQIDMAEIEGRVTDNSTRKLIEMVENHPEEAVAIMRTWMYTEV
ncbi:MAG: flagellar basal-body MS-ring/collar protein FliF [Alphaproteobacteria bacterium]|nr:flagellar basal-body MS-ring/collar protein FliF [Alphaproteobacteria bacterium]